MRKRMTPNLYILFLVFSIASTSAYSTEWIDCNGENIWAGVLISFEDDHIIQFHVHKNKKTLKDIVIPFTKADTLNQSINLTGKSISSGEVTLIANGKAGRLEMSGEAYSLLCDWSAFE